jgi:hypothetical protein
LGPNDRAPEIVRSGGNQGWKHVEDAFQVWRKKSQIETGIRERRGRVKFAATR